MPNNVINIRMVTIGQEPKVWAQDIEKRVWWQIQNELHEIGQNAHRFMQEDIQNNIKRDGSTGNLARSIHFNFETKGFTCRFWIGDINYLNENAKQWRWLNYGVAGTGRTTPPPNMGIFEGTGKPTSEINNEMWMHTGDKRDYLLIPKKPIEAKNFIAHTQDKLNQDIPKMLKNIDKALGGTTGKK